MFYKLIEKKRDEWFASSECTVKELVNYIEVRGQMRDAQIEAIKTWLFLKIACGNAPLWELFSQGRFNTLDIDSIPLSSASREAMLRDKGAAALMEYARQKDRSGKPLAPELEKFMTQNAADIDCEAIFKKIFYDVSYTDYLFSLPMGAGKTYLMAAFIYLDLYFAQNEPDNPIFAHNFIIMAPSGLKSSIIPSLKHIKEFDPSWIIPDPSATNLKRLIKFEVLDEQKSAKKSNIIKNPNAQKINNHQPLEDLMGLVAITNAEKVILDRADADSSSRIFSKDELERIKLANELRNIIGQIPHLSIYIDEVHHASDGEIKLRQVVTQWTKGKSFNSVLGFSGTPYLEKVESVALSEGFSIKNTELTNVVYYYPLISGVGNFLKAPKVRYADNDTETIVRNGVRDFLDAYKDVVYPNGTCAKLAIYCGQIETLEEEILPLVTELVTASGLNPAECILKYHKGNKSWPQPEGAETEFSALDTGFSRKKIVLLVQIGKEGWDCKSLTGVILPQKGVCPTNMVLQTSCRCLRQVTRENDETALIWLNKFNADTLNKQLKQQQNTSIQELNSKQGRNAVQIERFSRMEKLKVPPVDFYQLKVSYQTLIVENQPDTADRLSLEKSIVSKGRMVIHQQNLEGKETGTFEESLENDEPTSFLQWLQLICKESFNTLCQGQMRPFEEELRNIFEHITTANEGRVLLSKDFDQKEIRSLVRRAFVPKREFSIKEEIIPCNARLLQIEKLVSPVEVADASPFYPDQEKVQQIMTWDSRPSQELTTEEKAAIELLRKSGYQVPEVSDPCPERLQTWHYLPYRFDSSLEKEYFLRALTAISGKNLEIYFNGDDTLTEFKIDCYSRRGQRWDYIGKYVPDFLILNRDGAGKIRHIAIVETKGEGFAANFAERRKFMETEFVRKNNEQFGYERFRFLYLEAGPDKDQFVRRTLDMINEFFTD